ncbi:hypothetical protein DHD05_17160 [Arenibacter sp. N53]|nr:hypothetical protein [Arenibacter sp. N53]
MGTPINLSGLIPKKIHGQVDICSLKGLKLINRDQYQGSLGAIYDPLSASLWDRGKRDGKSHGTFQL